MSLKFFCTLLFSLLVHYAIHAADGITFQQPTTALQDDPLQFLQQAMKKAGGYESIDIIKLRTVRKNYNKWQNYNFYNPVPTTDRTYGEFDLKNKRIYFNTTSRYGGGYVFDFVTIGFDTSRYNYDALTSRNGYKMTKGGKRILEGSFSVINSFLPYYALKTVVESKDSLSIHTEKEGTVITRYLKNGTTQELYFSTDENNFLKIKTLQPGLIVETNFKDYTKSKELVHPKKIATYVNGDLTTEDEIISVHFNDPFNESLLTLPHGYTIVEHTTPPAMKMSEIKKDIFLIENVQGRNILVVSLDDGILLTEAPINSEVSKSIIDLVKKTLPGMSIKYVHMSHFHSDHSQGIRAFVNEGATIITTPQTAKVLMEIIQDTTGRFNDELLKTRRQPKFELFTKEKTLTNHDLKIVFYEVKQKHADGLSFLHMPLNGILYQGDLYSVPDDGTITPAIEVTKDFYKFMQKKKIMFERMIGHHGHNNITPAMLKKAVNKK